MLNATTSLLPFFLPAQGGQRYCLLHLPAPGQAARGGIIYIHPFAEELNKSRHVAAMQARAFAALGYSVLQLDLYGCGDSSGDFGDARWSIWRNDLHLACAWLARRVDGPLTLWGLRLGALLALDYAARAEQAPARMLLWQPVLSGAQHLNQFLRLRVAGEMLQDGGASGGTAALRARLQAGEVLEIGGYELHPALALAVEGVDAARLAAPPCRVDWFEMVPEVGRPPPPASARLVDSWRVGGGDVRLATLAGPAFWTTQEIAEAPALLDASANAYPGPA